MIPGENFRSRQEPAEVSKVEPVHTLEIEHNALDVSSIRLATAYTQ